jgi:hypothetical protein
MEDQWQIGRLERVDIRQIWAKEADDFTPWLAQHLCLLGEAIGMELELEAVEKTIGAFRADILARDVQTQKWVLIENQLERTDHCHPGQIVAYAAGLEVRTIVWIATEFTQDHRGALDWLNKISGGRVQCFGIHLEVWRIGTALAPTFTTISRPILTVVKKGNPTRTSLRIHAVFDKGKCIYDCLNENPAMTIRDIQRKAEARGYTISAAYISETRKAFFAERTIQVSEGTIIEAEEPLTEAAQA